MILGRGKLTETHNDFRPGKIDGNTKEPGEPSPGATEKDQGPRTTNLEENKEVYFEGAGRLVY